jgi:hypothetical protein
MTIADTPEKIEALRMLTLRSGLKLEVLGMKRHGKSCYAIIKEQYGLTGNKRSVLEKFSRLLVEKGILTTQ